MNPTVWTQTLETTHWQQQTITPMCSAAQWQPICIINTRSTTLSGKRWCAGVILVMISTSSLFALTRNWRILCWENNHCLPNTHAFFARDIIGTLLSIAREIGLWGRNCCPAVLWTSKQPSSRRRQNTHQAHLFVLGFSRIDFWEVESWHLWRSSNPSANRSAWVWKLNKGSRNGNLKIFCSARN